MKVEEPEQLEQKDVEEPVQNEPEVSETTEE